MGDNDRRGIIFDGCMDDIADIWIRSVNCAIVDIHYASSRCACSNQDSKKFCIAQAMLCVFEQFCF